MTDVLTSIQRILDKPDDEDCDGLLRDALRLSLLQHPDMEEDDQDTLYDCIWTLIGRYIESPEGEGEDAQILMTRLLWVVFPVLKPLVTDDDPAHTKCLPTVRHRAASEARPRLMTYPVSRTKMDWP